MKKSIGAGDRGREGTCPPPQNKKKSGKRYFWGQLLCKIRAFFRQQNITFQNFVNFSSKYHKNSGILIIFQAFFGHKCLAPVKLTELLHLWRKIQWMFYWKSDTLHGSFPCVVSIQLMQNSCLFFICFENRAYITLIILIDTMIIDIIQ